MKAYFTETEKVLLYMDKDKARTPLMKLYVVCNKKSLKFPDLRIYQIIFNVFQMLQLIFKKTYGRVLSSPNPFIGVFSVRTELLWVHVYTFSYMV